MNKTNNEIPITSSVLMDTIKDRDQWQARAEAAERACAHLKDCMREAAESVGCSWKWIFRPKLIADVEREDLGKGYVKAEDVKMLMAALRPFTLVNPCLFKTIKPSDTWLWKPSSNIEGIPGINAQHILDAKYALVRANELGI